MGWTARGHTSNLWLPGKGGQVVFIEPRSTGEVARTVHKPLARLFNCYAYCCWYSGRKLARLSLAAVKPVLGVADKSCPRPWLLRREGSVGGGLVGWQVVAIQFSEAKVSVIPP